MHIDSLNWNILNLLQQNARISNAAIGRKVGISSPAVSERIKKMEDAGLILGYKTLVSPFRQITNSKPSLPCGLLWVS